MVEKEKEKEKKRERERKREREKERKREKEKKRGKRICGGGVYPSPYPDVAQLPRPWETKNRSKNVQKIIEKSIKN